MSFLSSVIDFLIMQQLQHEYVNGCNVKVFALPSAVLVPILGHTMNELSLLDSVFRIYECLHCLVQCVSSPLKNVVYPCCFRSASCARSRCCPCIICFSKLSDFFLLICPKLLNFLAFTDSRRFLDTPALSSTQSFVCFAVHDTRIVYDEVLAFRKFVSFFHRLFGVSNFCRSKLLQATLLIS